MTQMLKSKSETLYAEVNSAKSFKLLTSSDFLLFPVLSAAKSGKLQTGERQIWRTKLCQSGSSALML